jgi:ATP-binding cassette subfamily G (WHITE) protein 2 (PDR)
MFLLFTSTFSHLLTVGMDHRETIVNMGALLFYLILIFCGVLVAYDELSKLWTFMYWLSPLTYLIRGMFAVGIAHKTVECSTQELILIVASSNLTCYEYFGLSLLRLKGRYRTQMLLGCAVSVP